MAAGWECLSGKFDLLGRMLHVLWTRTTDKIVIVSNYTQTLDLVSQLCRERGYPFVRLDGSTSISKRQKLVKEFCEPGGNQFVFLLSSKARGVEGRGSGCCCCFGRKRGVGEQEVLLVGGRGEKGGMDTWRDRPPAWPCLLSSSTPMLQIMPTCVHRQQGTGMTDLAASPLEPAACPLCRSLRPAAAASTLSAPTA